MERGALSGFDMRGASCWEEAKVKAESNSFASFEFVNPRLSYPSPIKYISYSIA
jgi:hypothetical protein